MEIYMLEYYKETDDGDTITEEYNLIGLYLSKKEAQNAKRKFALERKIDKNLLFVSMSEIGKVQWEGGFVSSDEIYQNTVTLTACFNEWLGIDKSPEESWEDSEYYNALCDVEQEVYNIKDIQDIAEHIRQVWSRRFPDERKSFEDFTRIAESLITRLCL